MNKEEKEYLREYLKEIIEYKGLQEELTYDISLEMLKRVCITLDDLQQRIEKGIEYNKQIIKDTKSFYRPTSDTIYSGDCLIDIAEQNISILGGKE